MTDILIVKFGALGDVIRTSYILAGLYRRYDAPRIYWLTAPGAAAFLRFNPFITEVVTEGTRGMLGGRVFDLVVSLDDEADILRIVDGLDYRKLTGAYLAGGVPAYTDDAAEWFDMGLISRLGKAAADALKVKNTRQHNEILADMLGIAVDGATFFNSPLVEARMAARFDGSCYNVGLNGGAGTRWLSKQLPLEQTVELVRHLLSMTIGGKKVRVYLLGGEEERARHDFIREAVASADLIDTGTDNTLLEFAAIVKNCDFLITSDSLALHLAISQGVRNLSFYAPTSAAEIGTFGTGVKVVSLAGDYCSYRRDADNSTITAARILEGFAAHAAVSEQRR